MHYSPAANVHCHRALSFSPGRIIWAAPYENVSRANADNEGPEQPAQLRNLGFRCPLTESLDTTECINAAQMPG